MSRLEKKCVIGATGFHLLMLAVLFVGPAFLSPSDVDDTPVMDWVPLTTTDLKVAGGGNPNAKLPPAAQPQPPKIEQPAPQPPPVQPKPEAQEEVKPPPPKVEPKLPVQRDPDPPKDLPRNKNIEPDSPEPVRVKKPHKVQISDTVVKTRDLKKNTNKTAAKDAADAAARAEAKEAAAAARRIASIANNIRQGVSQSVGVEIPGPGGGGVSYANYGQTVRSIYSAAWRAPEDLNDEQATIKVSVTIARDGQVLSSQIVQSSGSRVADRSIQAALDRVTSIGVSFPAGAKESQRTFIMTFNLKAKSSLG